ncbi:hypothetical protein [Salipiger mangrovisoli]|uniref:DUF4136 domain-containing protein n=1 Tax=Salipiger mangrovisoli TaxID=2865933 RepID=A0ABR9XBT4_9RHOB|nr:hypothetical protein [Salipiger mangrovisoli]MBE9640934.1 hypothetical protein [Salipiger mangrovisoli]
MFRPVPLLAAALAAVLTLSACANGQANLRKPVEPIGDFKLGFSEVVAPNIVKGPLSRDASAEEWTQAVDAAIEERFDRQTGGKYYHIGTSVEGYVLAQPGVPLVFSPKSALILRVTVWDDAAQRKLNDTPEQITVMEAITPETLAGSGLTQSREVQMRNLSANAALQIEMWMRRELRAQGWFGGEAAQKAAAVRQDGGGNAPAASAADGPARETVTQ